MRRPSLPVHQKRHEPTSDRISSNHDPLQGLRMGLGLQRSRFFGLPINYPRHLTQVGSVLAKSDESPLQNPGPRAARNSL
jgi:hypothetical protein